MKSLLLAAALVLPGCCDCDERPPPQQRPGDVVRELREAIAERRWEDGTRCFSEEARTRLGELLVRSDRRPGHHYGRLSPETYEPWLIEPDDRVVQIKIPSDGKAVVTVEHARPDAGEDRPDTLLLARNSEGVWEITDWKH